MKNCFKTSCFFCEKIGIKTTNATDNTKLIKLRKKEEQKTKIVALFGVLIILIMLIPMQTLFWLKNNKAEERKWFSQTESVSVKFKTG